MLTARSVRQLFTPPYFFQPHQIFKRLKLEFLWRSKQEALVTLPWNLPIKIDPHEAVGYNIASHGLYEMGVTETLWRLTEPGDLAVDAGANIGYTTSILGVRVGPTGRVISFEPHPGVFESLAKNVEMWKSDPRCGSFVLHQAALGKATGRASLHVSEYFLTNRGTAWVSDTVEPDPDIKTIEVPIRALDSILLESEAIGVLKMDVQGYELNVLHGMTRLLERGAVRDIIFEEEARFPAPTHTFLKSCGYSVFGLQELFAGVRCLPDAQPVFDSIFGQLPNYLATLNPGRAKALLGPAVWRSFGVGRLLPRRSRGVNSKLGEVK
jgi:FkbM family methyltransferase